MRTRFSFSTSLTLKLTLMLMLLSFLWPRAVMASEATLTATPCPDLISLPAATATAIADARLCVERATVTVQVRQADGQPATGVVAQVIQNTRVAGECTTAEDGRCVLDYELIEPIFPDVVLVLQGYTFSASFGVEGEGRDYPMDYITSDLLAFILDAPDSDGVVEDYNPDGLPVPLWRDMPEEARAAALATLAALPTRTIPPTSRPTETPTLTPRPSITPRPLASVTVIPSPVSTNSPSFSVTMIFPVGLGISLLVVVIVIAIAIGLAYHRRQEEKKRAQEQEA